MNVIAAIRTKRAAMDREWILRAVVPVPSGTDVPESKDFYGIRTSAGDLVPAQWERVTRDSIELMAEMPPAPDTEAVFHVEQLEVARARTRTRTKAGRAISGLITGRAIKLWANDPNKDSFEANLGGRVLDEDAGEEVEDGVYGYHRAGEYVTTVLGETALVNTKADIDEDPQDADAASHNGLFPVEGRQTLMGANYAITTYKGADVCLLELRVHNAFAVLNGDAVPNPDIHFGTLRLTVPAGFSWAPMVERPTQRPEAMELVRPLSGGKYHLLPQRGCLPVVRVAIWADGKKNEERARALLEQEGWGVCLPGYPWSWHTKGCGFGPHRLPLPEMGVVNASFMQNDPRPWTQIKTALSDGGNNMGPWSKADNDPTRPYMPWGSIKGGMTSGTEIHACEGSMLAWTGDPDQLMAWKIAGDCYSDRCRSWMFDHITGRPVKAPGLGDSFDVAWKIDATVTINKGLDVFGFDRADWGPVDEVRSQGLEADYAPGLLFYAHIDFAHYTRLTSKFLIPVLLDNDPMARDGLEHYGELALMFLHGKVQQFAKGAEDQPGIGGFLTRIQGWAMHTAGCLWHVFSDERVTPIAIRYFQGIEAAIMPGSKHVHAQTEGKLGGQVDGYAANNGISIGVPINGEFCIAQCLGGDSLNEALALIAAQVEGMCTYRREPGMRGIETKMGVWKEVPEGEVPVPFQTRAECPQESRSGKFADFYSSLAAGLGLWASTSNATITEYAEAFVGNVDIDEFWADKKNYTLHGSYGWIVSYLQQLEKGDA